MKTELPTKPGAYYWREKDGDEWELVIVVFHNDPFMEPTVKFVFNDFENDLKAMDGQWLPIPTADELLEGIDAWAVFVEGMIRCHSIASTKEAVKDQLPFFESMHNKKCTVEAVTIFRKEKE